MHPCFFPTCSEGRRCGAWAADLCRSYASGAEVAGGMVHIFNVTDPQRQAALKRVKVGDSLTAVGTEAFAIALEPV